MKNFIENINWKGDLKEQLVGSYLYVPEAIPEDKNARYVKIESLPKLHRIIRPGFMYTMDYVPERINIHVRDDYYIKDVKFG